MSLYAQYAKEVYDSIVFEEKGGFIDFTINTPELFVKHLYVLPEYRNTFTAYKLCKKAEKYAKERGCTYAISTVDPEINTSSLSLSYQLKYGMKIVSTNNKLIYLRKELI